MAKIKIKKGDKVLIIAGKSKGQKGRVLRIIPQDNRAIVEGVNFMKKHTKPNPQRQVQGGVLEKEAPLHISNLMLLDPDSGKPTRVGRKRLKDGQIVRFAKSSGSTLD